MTKKAAKKAAKNAPKKSGKKTRKKSAKVGRTKSPPKEEADSGSQPEEVPGFPVVGVGASAGGLEALKELFSNLPGDTNMGFVVVTHQHPGHTSMLAELLGEATSIPVTEAAEGMEVKPNHVYVAQPGGLLAIMNRTLHRLEALSGEAKRLPIDSFLRSLAQDQQEHAICIILSGTGTDGTLGLKAIKGESGMAMVQDVQSAQYAGMPSSAAGTGLADYVLAPAAMAKKLLAYATGPYLRPADGPAVPPEPLQRIYLQLRNRTGHDFSGYKSTTIRRRIERRMNVHGIEKPENYLRFLQDNPHEIDILFKELLISVTSYFRDPEAFEALAEPVTAFLKSRPEGYTIRVWVPGCATGEECYSIAMLLRECMAKLHRHLEVQIFGTDLDSEAIEAARAGTYPDGIAGDVSPQRLERFFTREEDGWRIRKEIREMCVFALQNVIKDAPFTKMDLVSCRNLLIYLGADLQKKILPVFHYALKPGGLLFLGPSESIGNLTDLFDPVCKKWKLYRRRELVGSRALPELPLAAPRIAQEVADPAAGASRVQPKVPTQIERLLLNWYCPASLVVNDRGDIIHVHGRTGAFLEPAEGQPRLNVLEMAREGLQIELSHAIRQATRGEKGEVVRENVRVKSDGEDVYASVTVKRIREPEALRGLLVITFRPVPPPLKTAHKKKRALVEPDRIEAIERELQYTKESLQTTIEELETSNEELKSTNEELQSTNEELQSTNEELETSKEEMQSLNEELTTVNAELQSKVEALAQTSDDMQNLLNSTEIATIFLDNKLNIKRYTDQARKIVHLIPTDVGRPIGDLVSKLRYGDLEEDSRKVFKNLKSLEIELQNENDDWYLMRIAPYRTSENVIDGLVITFVDISEVHRAAREAHLFRSMARTVRQPLVVLGAEMRVQACNPAFAKISGSHAEDLTGEMFFEIGGGMWNVPELRDLLEKVLPTRQAFEEFHVETGASGDKRHKFVLTARPLDEAGEEPEILLVIEEVR